MVECTIFVQHKNCISRIKMCKRLGGNFKSYVQHNGSIGHIVVGMIPGHLKDGITHDS